MSSEKASIGFIGGAIGATVMFFASLFGGAFDNNPPPATPEESTFNPCPVGWDYTDERDHVVVLQCSHPNGWVVLLNSDFTFNNALDTTRPDATTITDESQVPNW